MAHRQLHSLRNDHTLAPYVVEVTATGNQLGTGSYGSVEEVLVKGLPCAGKKIHEALLDTANAGVENIIGKYERECQLMSGLCHPNITLFIGVCFLPDSTLPVLVMERLDSSLDDLLETVPNIPLPLKRSMLEDVAMGLVYLHQHNPQIIHRDLTAKNVLLTSYFTAKITDFGNSRIVDLQPGQLARTMSQLPGTWVYMSPEALEVSSRYGPSLDIFSFGHLTLFVALQVFPGNLLHHTYPDPENPEKLVGRSEVERRQEYFDQLQQKLQGGQHPFVQFTKDCLHTLPSKRPTAEELVTLLKRMKADIEGPYGELAKFEAVKQVMTTKIFKMKDAEVRKKANEIQVKDEEIQRLHLRLEQQQEAHVAEIFSKDSELDEVRQRLTALIHEKDNEIKRLTSRSQAPSDSVQLEFQWRKGQNMPFKLSSYPQVVVMKGKVYFRGAHLLPSFSSESEADHRTILVYDPQGDVWTMLPPYSFSWFAMTVLNDQLVLVGGQALTRVKTGMLGRWDENLQTWTHPFPPMLKACNSPMVVTYKNSWLVVAGGFEGSRHLSVVQILDIRSKQWYYGTSLPAPISHVSTATIGNMFYLVGGFKRKDRNVVSPNRQVLCVCLPDLILQSITQDVSPGTSSNVSISLWQSLPSVNPDSTAVALNKTLLAIGGVDSSSSDIHLYQHSTKKWIKVGELPIGRSQCACAVLPSGEIFVAGGDASGSEQQVDIAQVLFTTA